MHFHEVGAVDSIVDIVGTAICLELLDVDEVYVSDVPLGTGFVNCAHGKIPVPAPATMEILCGVPVYHSGIKSELVTPTGAGIVKALAREFTPMRDMVMEKVGYGLGTKDLPVANILRVCEVKKNR